MLRLQDFSRRKSELEAKIKNVFSEIGRDFKGSSERGDKIRLVFCGQYSAGKSSILKMLTGRDDVVVGAGITTQEPHVYDWNGIEVVDTPGIHTQLRPDHDELSYKAIAEADMLVFVITNELFDDYMAAHFRHLAIDQDKGSEMTLVVNKMNRASLGNTEEQRKVITEDLRKVLQPYTPEQLRISFLDAKSYLDGMEKMDTNPERAEKLISRSGYSEFLDNLNGFVEDKGVASKLTTDLYVYEKELDDAIQSLQPKSEISSVDDLEANLDQQRSEIERAVLKMKRQVRSACDEASAAINNLGQQAANLLTAESDYESISQEWSNAYSQADQICSQCKSRLFDIRDNCLMEVQQRLKELEASEASVNLKRALSNELVLEPSMNGGFISPSASDGPGLGSLVTQTALGLIGPGGFLTQMVYNSLTNYIRDNDDSDVGTVTYQGLVPIEQQYPNLYRDNSNKEQEAENKAAKVMLVIQGGLMALSAFFSWKDRQKRKRELQNQRVDMINRFRQMTSDLQDYGRRFAMDEIDAPMSDIIDKLEDKIQKIRETRKSRSEVCKRMESLQRECRDLIRDIHQETQNSGEGSGHYLKAVE